MLLTEIKNNIAEMVLASITQLDGWIEKNGWVGYVTPTILRITQILWSPDM